MTDLSIWKKFTDWEKKKYGKNPIQMMMEQKGSVVKSDEERMTASEIVVADWINDHPERQWHVERLRIMGNSYKEIIDMLGIPVGVKDSSEELPCMELVSR